MKQLFFDFRKGLISLICLLAFSATGMAVNDEPKEALRKEIFELIDNPNLTYSGIQEAEGILHFTINKNNELVVLSVETETPFIEEYLKSRLNYYKLKAEIPRREEYKLKITIKNGAA